MKQKYSEGSIFLVPLGDGGYARGVVARKNKKGIALLGYFFGPRLIDGNNVSTDDIISDKSILRVRFGDLGIIKGEWPIIGEINPWIKSQWPMPVFVRQDELSKKAWLVHYFDDDPARIEYQTPTDYDPTLNDTPSNPRRNAGYGCGAVEVALTRLLPSSNLSLDQ